MTTARHGRKLLLMVFVLILFAPILCAAQDNRGDPGPHLFDMPHHQYFPEVLAASVVGWIVGLVKGFDTSKNWLKTYWPSAPLIILFILDLFIFVVVGGYFGTGIYNPQNFLAALAAGLSWPVGLGALTTKG